MKAAITNLEISLGVLENNEPIHRAEGKEDQADLAARNASEIRQALKVLNAAVAGPIWPEPSTEAVQIPKVLINGVITMDSQSPRF